MRNPTSLYLLPNHNTPPSSTEYVYNLSTHLIIGAAFMRKLHHPQSDEIPHTHYSCTGFPVTTSMPWWIQTIHLTYFMVWPGLTASRVQQ